MGLLGGKGSPLHMNSCYGFQYSLDLIVASISELEDAALQFKEAVKNVSSLTNASKSQQLNVIRIINDKLMNMERAFIHPEGLPGRINVK